MDMKRSTVTQIDRRFSVAPMMECTDRHDRFFLRLLSRHTLLYSEMVTTGAVLRGDRRRLLAFSPEEHPVALQLGGSDPGEMAESAAIAEAYGYDEVNINVGCPSNRVRQGRFGACLMAEPQTVAACVTAMRAACGLPVTVKTRLGIDDQDSFEYLAAFVEAVAEAGCGTVIVHARKAVLKGLSPKENREVPPLRYERVYRLKRAFPELEIVLNGGVQDLDTAARHLDHVDGVMLGRAAYHNPYLLADVDRRFFGSTEPAPSRRSVILGLLPYVRCETAAGVPLKAITRHVLGLYHGQPGGRAFRRHLSEKSGGTATAADVIEDAVALVDAVEERQAGLAA